MAKTSDDDRDVAAKKSMIKVVGLYALLIVLLLIFVATAVYVYGFARKRSTGSPPASSLWEDPEIALPSYVYSRR